MAFADGSQAEDETKISFGHVRLVRMRNYGRIKQGHRFDRIFSREISTEHEAPFL
jgi:hypothetical protein